MIIRKVNVLILGIVYFCAAVNGNDNVNVKNKIIRDIIEKVFNITAKSFINATVPSERNKILHKIENKLRKSAEPFGNRADKYVHVVMQGLKSLTSNSSILRTIREQSDFQSMARQGGSLKNSNNTKVKRKASDLIVDKIVKKILNLAKNKIDNAKTPQEKKFIIEIIKKKVLETAQKQHDRIHTKHNEIKTYADLITRGMELMIKKIAQSKTRTKVKKTKNISYEVIREEVKVPRKYKTKSAGQKYHNVKRFMRANQYVEITTPNTYTSTPSTSCEVLVMNACMDIKSLNRYTCPGKGKTLSLSKLCDGAIDCPGELDEVNCIDQAMAQMRKATQIMSLIENALSLKCFLTSDNSILVGQNTVLNGVLQKQIQFLQKYSYSDKSKERLDSNIIKKTIQEVVIVINALTVALQGTLCSEAKLDRSEIEFLSQKSIPIMEKDVIETKEPLEICDCNGATCVKLSCPESCRLVCWYKHNLVRWVCQAVDEGTSVPLDMVCDGKMDCYDETDELGCATGASNNKFEANEKYDIVLKMIKTISVSKEYSSVQTKLLSLYNSVSMLQKTTMKPKVDVVSVRSLRERCFSTLKTIYEDIAKTASVIEDLDEANMFLMSINEKLVSALKHSHTGNDKILAQDGCYCRENKCIVPRCSKSCQQACSVRPRLTKYWCKGTANNNISIPIDWICNKRQDCPLEDDEAQCVNDVCRKHHLIVLRQGLRDIGKFEKTTSLSESLKSWKTKVTATLRIAEKNFRPTPTIFRDVIRDILNDLAMTYAVMEDSAIYKRTKTDTAFKEFFKVSQRVIDSLRSCDK